MNAALVSNVSYAVELDLSEAGEPDPQDTFRSRTVITFDTDAAGSSTWLDLIADRVRTLRLNGRALDPSEVFDGSRVQLAGLDVHNTVEVDAECRYMRTGEGLHRFIDRSTARPTSIRSSRVADARRVYACFEQPSLKADWQLTVTAPSHWQMVSNSPTPSRSPPVKGPRRGGSTPTPRLDLHHGDRGRALPRRQGMNMGPHGTYPLGVFCRNSLAAHLDADEIFTLTKQGFEFFEETFATPYPFAKYDQLFVPEFNAGAMENAGCVTFP